MYLGEHKIDETLTFNFQAYDGYGQAVDPSDTPSYSVYKNNEATAITGTMAKLDGKTGFYGASLALTTANGFVAGYTYTIRITATVDGVAVQKVLYFDIVTALVLVPVEWPAGDGTPPSGEQATGVPVLSPAGLLAYCLITVLEVMGDTDEDWPLFVSHLPDTPANAAAIYDTSGVLDGRLMASGTVIEHYGLQIKLRSSDYQTGWQKIRQIVLYLRALNNNAVDVDDMTYEIKNMSQSSPITYIGVNDKREYEFTVNYLLTAIQTA